MSLPNDENNKRRRLREALAAANINTASLGQQGQGIPLNIPGLQQKPGNRPSNPADLATLNQLQSLLGASPAQPVPATTASRRPSANQGDLMAALLGLSNTTSTAPPRAQEPQQGTLDLARLLGGPGQQQQRPSVSLMPPAPAPRSTLAHALTQLASETSRTPPAPTPAAAPSSSDAAILALLAGQQTSAPAPPAAAAPPSMSASEQALLALLGGQASSSVQNTATPPSADQLLTLLAAGQNPTPPAPAPVASSTDAILALLGGQPAAAPPASSPESTLLALLGGNTQGRAAPAPSATRAPEGQSGLDLQALLRLSPNALREVTQALAAQPAPAPATTTSSVASMLQQLTQQQEANPNAGRLNTVSAGSVPLNAAARNRLLSLELAQRATSSLTATDRSTAATAPSALMAFQMALAPTKATDKKSNKRKAPPAPTPQLRKAPLGMTGHAPETLYMECDDERLSAYHILARKHIEFFEASDEDTSTNARGRNRPIVLGQVGIRCKHCSHIAPRRRQRAAMYYPFKLDLLYQASQTLANVHLCEQCQHIPPEVRVELNKLRGEKTTALVGKKYWADGARIRGVYETEDGMRFEAPSNKEGEDQQLKKEATTTTAVGV